MRTWPDCGSHPGVRGWCHTRLQCQGGGGIATSTDRKTCAIPTADRNTDTQVCWGDTI